MIKRVQVHIESMAFKGYGVTRIDGKVLFVPYSVAEDKAWVEITETKKNYSIGKLSELIEPSGLRTNPPCPYFGVCGGCQWQHIDHSVHREFKKEIFTEILKRLGGLKEVPSIDVVPSPQPYGYRVRVQLKVRGDTMGYYEERSHRIVDIDHCPIAHPLVNQIISSLRKAPPSFFQAEEIEINTSPEEEKGILILHPLSAHQRTKHSTKEFLQSHPILKGIAVMGEKGLISLGNPSLNFTIPFNRWEENSVLRLRTSPKSFFQVNLGQNQRLIQTVLEFSDVRKDERVLDLYAGVGNFSLPLAMASKEVLGIEENRAAVEDARFNAERNEIKNCNFIHGRVEDLLEQWKGERPDLMILDPPRTGCKAIWDQVVRLKPKKIVYISCEPTTFSRDLRLFSEVGYSLQKLTLVDMFPQTYHMEVVGLLAQSQVKV
jgi:23S rRNA (uracil1939-C5)-methyltransferase